MIYYLACFISGFAIGFAIFLIMFRGLVDSMDSRLVEICRILEEIYMEI